MKHPKMKQHDGPIIHRLIQHTSETIVGYVKGETEEEDIRDESIHHTFITELEGIEDPEADPVIIEMDTSNIKTTDDLNVSSGDYNPTTNKFDFNIEPAVPISGTVHWRDKEYPIITYKTRNRYDQVAGEPNVQLRITTSEPY